MKRRFVNICTKCVEGSGRGSFKSDILTSAIRSSCWWLLMLLLFVVVVVAVAVVVAAVVE